MARFILAMKILGNQFNGMTFIIVLVIVICSGCIKKFSERFDNASAGLNGGFEISESDYPVNWNLYTPKTVPEADFDLLLDNQKSKTGKQSLKFAVRKCRETGGWLSPGLTRELEVDPNGKYKVSFWAQNEGSKFRFLLEGVQPKKGKNYVEIFSSETLMDWQKFEYEIIMTENYPKLRLELNIIQPGTFWIDDLTVVKIE